MKSSESFLGGAAATLIARTLGLAVGLALHTLLARLLAPHEYGVYLYGSGWLLLAAFFSQLGYTNVLVRFVATAHGERAWPSLRGVVLEAHRVVALVASAATLAVAGVLSLSSLAISAELEAVLWIGLPIIPLTALLALCTSVLQGILRPVLSTVPDQLIRPLLLGIGVLAFFLFRGDSPDARTTMGVAVGSTALALAIGWLLIHRHHPMDSAIGATDRSASSEWRSVALGTLLLASMNQVSTRADAIMIGAFLTPTDVALYGVASRLSVLLAFPMQALSAFIAPSVADLFASKRMAELQARLRLAASGIFALALPASAILVFFGDRIIGLLFGAEFAAADQALRWLVVGQLIQTLAGSVTLLMTMTGHQRTAARIAAGSALINLVLNAALIPRFGIQGAAFATTTSLTITSLGMLIYVNRVLGLDPTIFAWLRRTGSDSR